MKHSTRKYVSGIKRNRRKAFQKKVLTILLMAMAIVFVFCGFTAMGNTDPCESVELVYESITVEPGDTLWSIANIYAGHTEDSVHQYINKIKKMNNLHGDRIVNGEALLIYYYPE